jgi:hypothetical protein
VFVTVTRKMVERQKDDKKYGEEKKRREKYRKEEEYKKSKLFLCHLHICIVQKVITCHDMKRLNLRYKINLLLVISY